MRYIIDITNKQSEEISRLINIGKYQNIAQFISTAVDNQIYIETNEQSLNNSQFKKDEMTPLITTKDILNVSNKIEEVRKKIIIKGQPQTVIMPTFSELAASLSGVEETRSWLWGQINKILPIKIGLRVLYAFLGSEQWMDLEEYSEKAAEIAAAFGTIIRDDENKKGKTRDEKISAGLPDEKEFKSKVRYKTQFLAYIRKDGRLEGALTFLRFVNLKQDEKNNIVIGLTEPGLNFAKLDNSVINNFSSFKNSLTNEEIDFYLDHISRNVIGEHNAILWVLDKISKGINNIEALNKVLKKDMWSIWGNPTDAIVNTQRSGLMARMLELSLLDKKKEGIRVEYTVSYLGVKYLQMQQ